MPESSVIESPSTPLNLSTFSLSVNEIDSSSLTLTTDSKKRKERDFDTHNDSSAPIVYELRSRKDSIGAGNLDADMKKLMEAREKARVKAANARRAAKARAKALTEKKLVVVEKKKRRRKKKKKKKNMKQKAKKNIEIHLRLLRLHQKAKNNMEIETKQKEIVRQLVILLRTATI